MNYFLMSANTSCTLFDITISDLTGVSLRITDPQAQRLKSKKKKKKHTKGKEMQEVTCLELKHCRKERHVVAEREESVVHQCTTLLLN